MVSLATPTPLLIRSPCESTSSSVQDQPPPSKLPANTCPASVASHARSGVGRAIAVKRAPIEAWLGGVMLRNTPPALRQSNVRPLLPTTTPSPDALTAIALAAEEAVTTDPGSQPGTLSRSHPARRS